MNLNVLLDTNLKVHKQLNRSIMAPKEKGGYLGAFLIFFEVVWKEKGAEGWGLELYDTLTKWFQQHTPKPLLKCSTQEQMLKFFLWIS